MMQRVVTGLFDSETEAERATEKLASAGVNRDQITLVPGAQASSALTTQDQTSREPASEGGFWESLKQFFMPEDDRHSYAEGLRRGAVMLSVRTDDSQVSAVEEILEGAGAVNMEEREASWRAEGWTGYTGTTTGVSPATPQRSATTQSGLNRFSDQSTTAEEESVPVVEEELAVGKRLASEGRVRVRSYVVNTPVQEQVKLREDNVQIERRPVDRPAGTAETAFEDRAIEAEASREEPVVSKHARVKEEVTLKKQPVERTETVSDTVRRTEVKVEDERARPPTPRSSSV
jgi:uncharacterized protein (TIGR02271 family)